MTFNSCFRRSIVFAAAALFFFLNGCGSAAPNKTTSSSGNNGFAGQDIDDIKAAPKEELPKHKPVGMTLTPAAFETEVAQSKGLVMVDFWADWCGPCLKMAPIIAESAVELAGKMKFTNIDLSDESDKNPLAMRFNIDVLPTLIIFKDGKEVARKIGGMTKEEFKAWLQSTM